ncbi:MAG: hypothetical protein A2X64_03255 [Ignavibacteria bacterium GWF2_33_9]|nr:MAG: hypothetical protein A2X64_03255 [Ignavibacteria bacterium GWF2_33_9]
MKFKIILLGIISFALISCSEDNGPAKNVDLKTFDDSASYALGVQLGMGSRRDSMNINLDIYNLGFQNGKDSTDLLLPDSTMQKVFETLQAKMQAKQMEAQDKAQKEMEEKGKALAISNKTFLAENKNKPGVKVTKSGLQYEVKKAGSGVKAQQADLLKVKFTASFANGEVFDTTAKNNAIDFPVVGLFPGWTEAATMMQKGGKYVFVFPPEIAFGDRPAGPIPPNSVIIFNVECVDVNAGGNKQGYEQFKQMEEMRKQQEAQMKNQPPQQPVPIQVDPK